MIRLGINTMIWSGRFEGKEFPLLEKIRAWGYEVVELPVFDFAAVDLKPLRRAVASSGLALTVSSALPAGLSLVSADAGIRRATREWLREAVDTVAAIDGTLLAGPMYAPVGELPGHRRTESEWRWAVDEYRRLGAMIDGSGVRLAVEPLNRFETWFLNTAEDARKLGDEIGSESIGILFDTFHAGIEEDDITAALASLEGRLFHVHLSENNRGIPGCGHIPFTAVIETLRAMRYSGYAVVESFASAIPEIARATAMWRDYAGSPDEFAMRAIENLRPLFAAEASEPGAANERIGGATA
jgi:D-psicose/D-tagatose/L-ribulose 3-epimerase